MLLCDSFAEWVVRLPGQLSFIVTGCLIYVGSRKYIPDNAAVWAALFFLTSGEILFYGLIIAGQIDIFYTLLVFLQITTLLRGLTTQSTLLILTSYLFLAFGTMTKGLPSIAIHALSVTSIAIVNRSLSVFWRWQHLAGGFCF